MEFRAADMRVTGCPDSAFDAVISVFSIFFVPEMAAQVRELWRLVRPGGTLAITTWGPRIFEPASTAWRGSWQKLRPDLYSDFNPWDRVTEPDSLRALLAQGVIAEAEVTAEPGPQPFRTPEDWWSIVLGSGYRWVVEQMGTKLAEQARRMNLELAGERGIESIETNVLFALARKRAV